MPRQKIVTFLWFDTQAEEAARFYVSIFKDSRLKRLVPGPGGTVLIVEFQLAGIDYLALNGGPQVKFNEAISLSVECGDQAEVDDLWERLSEGGRKCNADG
jgi:predicted 3-demethylubiquinone-9 3-methyltransferase (glyoxalase superfamily)